MLAYHSGMTALRRCLFGLAVLQPLWAQQERAAKDTASPAPATSPVLAAAQRLATTTYRGFTSGPGENGAAKQIDCTCYVAAVCSELARTAGRPLTAPQLAAVKIANLDADERAHLQQLVDQSAPKIRGVAQALVDAGLGTAIAPQDAQPGDFVQYWYEVTAKDGTKQWLGHAAIVERFEKKQAVLLGSHKTTLRERADGDAAIAVDRGGIGSGPRFDLADPKRRVFVVRWTAKPRADDAHK